MVVVIGKVKHSIGDKDISEFYKKIVDEVKAERKIGGYILVVVLLRDTILPLLLIYTVTVPIF